jgi:hypothetical protein
MAKKKQEENNKVKKPIPSNVKDNKTKALQADLSKLAKEINEQGLTFLIKQAQTLISNSKIAQANKEKVAGKIAAKGPNVRIFEGENKANFIIQIANERKFFSRDDFRGVVKVAQSGNNIKDLSSQMFNWMMKERKDFLIDNNIQNNNDARLSELINLIKSKYKAKS